MIVVAISIYIYIFFAIPYRLHMYVFPQQQQQQKQKKLMSWTQTPNQTLLYKKGRSLDTPATGKVAAFDIDWCVIRTKSRRPFAVDPSDWEFWCPSVRDKLRQLPKMGYQIVFFTNQAGLLKTKEKLLDEALTKIKELEMYSIKKVFLII